MSSIVLWNDRTTGHHPPYMRALAEAAASTYEQVWLPRWSREYLPSRLQKCASFLPDDASADIARVAALVRELRPQLTVIADATSHLPHLAVHRWPGRVAIIDIRSQQCDLVFSHGLRKLYGALHLAIRELIARRQTATFHVLDHRACAIGSARLRQGTFPMPELRQRAPIDLRDATNGAPRSTPPTAVLMGTLDERKGLDLLVQAASLLTADREAQRMRFLVAGVPVERYKVELTRIMEYVQQDGLPFDFRIGYQAESAYFKTLFEADYVLLPYVRHRGGSGLLASLDGYTGNVIASDGGWLGEIAKRIGIHTFHAGDAADLARVIQILEHRRRINYSRKPLSLPDSLYADAHGFGKSILKGLDA